VKSKQVLPSISEQSSEFCRLLSEILEILEQMPTLNLGKLKTVCYSVTSKDSSLAFTSQEIAKIKACTSVHDMFYELRNHWRYDDHPLLYSIVKRSGSPEAMQKRLI